MGWVESGSTIWVPQAKELLLHTMWANHAVKRARPMKVLSDAGGSLVSGLGQVAPSEAS